MKTFSQDPKHQFDSYYQHNSVILQFILKDFFIVTQEIEALLEILEKMRVFDSSINESEFEGLLEKISYHLTILSGPPHFCPWNLPWNNNGGLLTQIKDYFYLLACNAQQEDRLSYLLHDSFHKSWSGCKQISDLIAIYFYQKWRRDEKHDRNRIKDLLHRSTRSIKQASKLLLHIIFRFRHDENVLFFLVRHHFIWKNIFSQQILAKLMQKLYPGGIVEVKNILIRHYSQRGFDFLLPVIDEKMDEIEKAICEYTA